MRTKMLATVLLAVWPLAAAETALDRYVAEPDPHYKYEIVKTAPGNFNGEAFTTYAVDLTSQEWRSPAEVNHPIWTHWLNIIKPDHVTTSTGFLYINGGSNKAGPPPAPDPMLAILATTTHTVVAELRMVPNEPLVFAGETRLRSEDAIVAYTWDKFLRGGDDYWPLRLPMTKAAVRAMDTVSAIAKVDKFVVAGGSKRGWTTWTTAAVDKRVIAIIPFVIDMLNIEPSFEHHFRAYGFWSPAVKDYLDLDLMDRAGTPRYEELLKIIEPYEYRDRLTMPKYIVNAAGDQFFLPDSSQFYFNNLKGEKYLRYVPNTNHSLAHSDARECAVPFYQSIVDNSPRPKFSWKFDKDGTIRVKSETKPTEVRLWQATNPKARDFRLDTIGPAYTSTIVKDRGHGIYIAKAPRPPAGYTAYFMEMTYPAGGKYPFKFTSGVRVTPDMLPSPPPPKHSESERATESGSQ